MNDVLNNFVNKTESLLETKTANIILGIYNAVVFITLFSCIQSEIIAFIYTRTLINRGWLIILSIIWLRINSLRRKINMPYNFNISKKFKILKFIINMVLLWYLTLFIIQYYPNFKQLPLLAKIFPLHLYREDTPFVLYHFIRIFVDFTIISVILSLIYFKNIPLTKLCSNCGTKALKKQKFCMKCGQELK